MHNWIRYNVRGTVMKRKCDCKSVQRWLNHMNICSFVEFIKKKSIWTYWMELFIRFENIIRFKWFLRDGLFIFVCILQMLSSQKPFHTNLSDWHWLPAWHGQANRQLNKFDESANWKIQSQQTEKWVFLQASRDISGRHPLIFREKKLNGRICFVIRKNNAICETGEVFCMVHSVKAFHTQVLKGCRTQATREFLWDAGHKPRTAEMHERLSTRVLKRQWKKLLVRHTADAQIL